MIPSRRVVTRRTLLVGSLAAVATGCTTHHGTSPEPTPTPTPEPPPYEGAALPRLNPRKVLSTVDTPVKPATSVDFIDDRAVLSGNEDGDNEAVAVVELATGRTIWDTKQLKAGLKQAVPGAVLYAEGGLAGRGSDAVVVAEYYLSPCPDSGDLCHQSQTTKTEERGLFAVSVDDGSLAWSRALIPSVPTRSDEAELLNHATLVVVERNQTSVLTNVGDAEVVIGHAVPKEGAKFGIHVLDATTGTIRWTAEDMLAVRTAGDVVLAEVVTGRQSLSGAAPIAALDLQTGKVLWTSDANPRRRMARWFSSTAGLAVVGIGSPRTNLLDEIYLVDPRTGVEVAVGVPLLKTGVIVGTDSAGEPLAVWTGDPDTGSERGYLSSFVPGEPSPTAARLPADSRFSPVGAKVHGGYVWCSDDATGKQIRAIDRSGAVCSDWLAGRLELVDDEHLVVDASTAEIQRGSDIYQL